MYGDVLGDIGIMSIQSTFSMVLGIVSLFLCPIISKKIGLEKMVRACLLIGAVCYLGLFGTMMVTNISALVYMVWSSVATDYNEYVTGKRTEGTIYGVFNLSRRIGQTVGNSAAVAALGWIGYQAGAATQSAGTITGIKALCVLIPAIALVGSWIAFRFVWNITPQIRADMAARKSAAE